MKSALFVCALGAASVTALGQQGYAGLVVGNDGTDAAVFVYNGSNWVELFHGVPVWGMAADPANCVLYMAGAANNLMRWSRGEPLPTDVGAFTNSANGQVINFTGLAFLNGQLIGCRHVSTASGVEGIYTINPGTAAATLAWQHPDAFDFGALDANAATGQLFALNDSPTAGAGRGLYRIVLSPASATLVTPYPPNLPGSADGTDVDGLAVGNNRAFLVPDEPGGVSVYLLTGNFYEGLIPNPWVSASVFSAAAWAPCMADPCPPCIADYNGSGGTPDDADVSAFFAAWGAGNACADANRSGGTPDDADVTFFFARWNAGGC